MTHLVNPDEYLVDAGRSVSLRGSGLDGYAVVAVDPRGEEVLVLGSIGSGATALFDIDPPPHEQTGPLPDEIRGRVWSHPVPPIFCGTPQPIRQAVPPG